MHREWIDGRGGSVYVEVSALTLPAIMCFRLRTRPADDESASDRLEARWESLPLFDLPDRVVGLIDD